MNSIFPKASLYDGDVYVADYTNQTNSESGVCILQEPADDIAHLHLENPRHIRFWGVNFEEHPAFFKGLSNCECMFVSAKARKRAWACLAELKYCLEKNIETNSEHAFSQLEKTLNHLIKENVLTLSLHRIYLNVSIPDHSHREPFLSFMVTQDEVITQMQKTGVVILGYNNLLILNESFLRVPQIPL